MLTKVQDRVQPPKDRPEEGFPLPLHCQYDGDGSHIIYAADSYNTARNPVITFDVTNKEKITKKEFYPQTPESDLNSGFIAIAVHPKKNIVATLLYPTMLLQYWDFIKGKVIGEKEKIFDKKDVAPQHLNYVLNFSPSGKKIVVLSKKHNKYIILDTDLEKK